MRQIEANLEAQFPMFNRIWVQYSNNGKYRLCITLFPSDNSGYRMIFGETNILSEEKMSNLIREKI